MLSSNQIDVTKISGKGIFQTLEIQFIASGPSLSK